MLLQTLFRMQRVQRCSLFFRIIKNYLASPNGISQNYTVKTHGKAFVIQLIRAYSSQFSRDNVWDRLAEAVRHHEDSESQSLQSTPKAGSCNNIATIGKPATAVSQLKKVVAQQASDQNWAVVSKCRETSLSIDEWQIPETDIRGNMKLEANIIATNTETPSNTMNLDDSVWWDKQPQTKTENTVSYSNKNCATTLEEPLYEIIEPVTTELERHTFHIYSSEQIDYGTSDERLRKRVPLEKGKMKQVLDDEVSLSIKKFSTIFKADTAIPDASPQAGNAKFSGDIRALKVGDNASKPNKAQSVKAYEDIGQDKPGPIPMPLKEDVFFFAADISSDNEEALTPAQIFFLENKERLLSRARHYYSEKHEQIGEDNEWNYYRDPVVRPGEHHLWDYGVAKSQTNSDNHQVELEKGKMLTVQQIVAILENERGMDIRIIDLEQCGRRDVGLFAVVVTGQTASHCRRMGRLIWRIVRDLEIPHVSKVSACSASKNGEWVISQCGPVQVHLFTEPTRNLYKLEDLWLSPHEHFHGDEFPAYFDYTGVAPPPFLLRNTSVIPTNTDHLFSEFTELSEHEDLDPPSSVEAF